MSNFDKVSGPSRVGTADSTISSQRTPSSQGLTRSSDETMSSLSNLTLESRAVMDAGRGRGLLSRGGRADDGDPIIKELVTKPEHVETKMGSSGTRVQLKANMFQVEKLPDFEFNQYRVDFEPELDMDNIRKAFIGKNLSKFGGYLYDGGNILFTTTKLPQDTMEFMCESREGKSYKLMVKFSNQTIDKFDHRVLLVMNIMLRRAMEGLNLKLIQRNLFDPEAVIDIKEFKLNLWPGYQTSIRQYEDNVLLNCDMRFKVMRQETVYDILRACCAENDKSGRDAFKAQIIGSIVLANYGKKRTYRVDDVDFNITPKSTFDWKGRTISYMEYFKEQYSIQIRDPNQPIILSKPKERDIRGKKLDMQVCLVPELLIATGLTDNMRSNFQLMRAMAEHTRMDPLKRVERLSAFNKRLQGTKESLKQFSEFHMKLKPELVEFAGREIAQETMIFGENKEFKNDARNVDWTNAMKTACMYTNVDLKRWAILSPKRAMTETTKFLSLLNEVAAGMKYTMGSPKVIELADDRVATYGVELQKVIKMDPKFIMIILPNNNADRYAAVKKITCVQAAIPTQVVCQKTMQPKKGNWGSVKSVATKVLIQMNCKLGGSAWMVKMPIGGVMTVGFDVTHDSTDKRKSYGAFVAALDLKKKVKFFSSVAQHAGGVECSTNIAIHMRKALMSYQSEYGTFPERILFYRDGVGDGDIEYVHKNEVDSLKAVFKELYVATGTEPKFAFIIVNKRINVRIFKSAGGSRVENPPSGTVVDNTITQPERYDFYLISQSVRQGSVAPTSYNIIYDTFGLPADKLQILTYKNCHLYYNWSGTTRVPAVVQYCQKLAMLVGQHLHALPQVSLDSQLYFL